MKNNAVDYESHINSTIIFVFIFNVFFYDFYAFDFRVPTHRLVKPGRTTEQLAQICAMSELDIASIRASCPLSSRWLNNRLSGV